MDDQKKPLYQRLASFLSFNRRLTDSWKVRHFYAAVARSRNFQARRAAVRSKVYLNAGCGPNINPHFINLDYDWAPGIDLCWDLRKRLPFADDSISGVYSEHCLEHLTYGDCLNALREFKRVLRPDGILRVVVPDAELYFDLYQRHKAGEQVSFPYMPTPPPEDFTPLMAINRVFREPGHLYAYDAVTLGQALEQAGLRTSKRKALCRVGMLCC
ncbi:MAG: methyltransferase domain-containing protein [Pyrinomonadaceae bacterium]|nr:methyltransferase domain-containing protein [Pyrinomonadaceae bacterium]